MTVSVKMDKRMRAALQRIAKKEFSSMSGILKKAADEYLMKKGIDWKKPVGEKKE